MKTTLSIFAGSLVPALVLVQLGVLSGSLPADFGVNRQRIEAIRAAYLAQP